MSESIYDLKRADSVPVGGSWLCSCGCGSSVVRRCPKSRVWQGFIWGHQNRGRIVKPLIGPSPQCDCGCGVSVTRAGSLARWNRRIRGHLRPIPIEASYKVDGVTGCWNWFRRFDRCGYGVASVRGVIKKAHRLFYELRNGPIQSGLVVDHLCRNRKCVNPDHLESVSITENTRRAFHSARERRDSFALGFTAGLAVGMKIGNGCRENQ